MKRRKGVAAPMRAARAWVDIGLGTAAYFLAMCLNSAATGKLVTIALIALTLSAAFLFYGRLRDRLKPPIIALGLVVAMDGVSCLYAASGKFALYEALKVVAAFCLALLLLAFTGEKGPERAAASILEGCCAIAGVVSIDLLSTRWISTPVLTVLGWFTTDYTNLTVVEDGVRMTSMFMNPNVFAGCIGIGVLLSLGLAASATSQRGRMVHLVCLSVNSLAFILAFSMGACAAIAVAFVVFLILEGKERWTGLLILMVETLTVTVLAAFPVSITSMTVWEGVQPIPLLCMVLGAVALCVLEQVAGRRLAGWLTGRGRAVLCFAGGIAAVLVLFVVLACNLTTGVTLQAGESLRRSAYPEPGSYTLTAEGGSGSSVTIESQNRVDTMMHTSSRLYQGPVSGAGFTVPEDSLVVWFEFEAEDEVRLESVSYEGEAGSGQVMLGYRLLPGFISNRLQGLRANQNAIQRFVFFEDGLKLFYRSPVIGLGLGVFENGLRSVQSFRYDTKYAHNHYIQTMAETGMVGLVLFLGLLAVCAAAVWRGCKKALAPALGAALVFMAGHGAVELVFSAYPYLPIAFGVFATISLCCGDSLPQPAWAEKKAVRNGTALGVCALLALFGVLLGCNITAKSIAASASRLEQLEQAAALDPFERADYMLTYVAWVTGAEPDEEERRTADEYARRLEKIPSNTIPIYLAEYYLDTGRTEEGLEMVEQYVEYVSSVETSWERAFEVLEKYEQDTEAYRAGVARIAGLLESWNRENMGYIVLSEKAQAFIARMSP